LCSAAAGARRIDDHGGDPVETETEGTGDLVEGPAVGCGDTSDGVDGAPVLFGRPFAAATKRTPLSSNLSVRTSWHYAVSRSTNPLPSESTRTTRPGDSVPTSRLPALSTASEVACVAFVL
jgi:hypothetical protein